MTPPAQPGPDPFDEFMLLASNGKEYRLPKVVEWKEGPPPEEGWWPASSALELCPTDLRYWDGQRWSLFVMPWDDQHDAARAAAVESCTGAILWADRWWEHQ